MSGEPVLVVDDNEMNLRLMRAVLERQGYEVHTATNADETFALLATVRPRVILMDLQLPGLDGLELTRLIKANPATRDITVVVLSAHDMSSHAARARAIGCDGYISKPIDIRTLPKTVEGYLGRR